MHGEEDDQAEYEAGQRAEHRLLDELGDVVRDGVVAAVRALAIEEGPLERQGGYKRRGAVAAQRGEEVEHRGGALDALRVGLVANAPVQGHRQQRHEDLVAEARPEELRRLVVRGHAVRQQRAQRFELPGPARGQGRHVRRVGLEVLGGLPLLLHERGVRIGAQPLRGEVGAGGLLAVRDLRRGVDLLGAGTAAGGVDEPVRQGVAHLLREFVPLRHEVLLYALHGAAVDGLATSLQHQQVVEHRECEARGRVHGGHDRAALLGQLLQQRADLVGHVRVQARGRLIQEDHLRARDEG
mmetsp:Transcript_15167/g.39029  ORF Transcript_15167/g.39029 Transcript_15167/m.39029 type:complete len:297 (+) Transcript_15167:674-1564(+)